MRLSVFLNGILQHNVVELDSELGYVKRFVEGKVVTERGAVKVKIVRVLSDFIESDTHIVEDTI
jgi:hypothetical protein